MMVLRGFAPEPPPENWHPLDSAGEGGDVLELCGISEQHEGGPVIGLWVGFARR